MFADRPWLAMKAHWTYVPNRSLCAPLLCEGRDGVEKVLRGSPLDNPSIGDADGFAWQLGQSGEDDNWNGRIQFFHPARHREAIHSGHPIIHNHQIDFLELEQPYAFFAAPGIDDLVSSRFKQILSYLTEIRLIIDAQDGSHVQT